MNFFYKYYNKLIFKIYTLHFHTNLYIYYELLNISLVIYSNLSKLGLFGVGKFSKNIDFRK